MSYPPSPTTHAERAHIELNTPLLPKMAALDAALQELLRSDKEQSTVALSTVQKIVNNILSHQDEPKYRRLRAENRAIKEKVLGVVGGGALLQALGFTAQGDELVLPMESSSVKLLQVRRAPRLY